MAAITRLGFSGPMAAYGTFQAKTAGSAADEYYAGTSMLLTGVGHLLWLVIRL